MKEIKQILKVKSKRNKKLLSFLFGLALIGVVAGSVFLTFIHKTDQELVKEYITSFLSSVKEGNLNYLDAFKNTCFSNVFYILAIFVLSLSIIGTPIVLFLYFVKCFMIGFSISSFVFTYGFKGIFFSFLYIIPHFINLIFYTLLLIYAIKISYLLITTLFGKKEISLKKPISNYITYTCLLILLVIVTSIMESICVPFLLKQFLFILK